jgi:hypothetical protein
MADPKGNLVTPVAFNPSGYPLALEVDANGYLKVATAAAGNFLVGTHGYVNGAWQKNPILFGYSDGLWLFVYNYNLSAGTNILETSAVPANWIWVVTQVNLYYYGTSPSYMECMIIHSSTVYWLFRQARPVIGRFYDRQGWWILAYNDILRMIISGAVAGDTAILSATGFKVQLNA